MISKLIFYCYTTDYRVDPHTALAINFHAEMYAMAEKFDLKNLKNLAKRKFVTALHCLEPGFNVTTLGNETLTRVLGVIPLIYSTTLENDRGLRDLVVKHVARHWHLFVALRQFKTFMAANTDFIIEVIEAKETVCGRCKKDSREKECRLACAPV